MSKKTRKVRKPTGAPARSAVNSAGFVVDKNLNIVEFIGHTAPFLAIPSGAANMALLRILKPELRPSVERALRSVPKTASEEERPVRLRGPRISISGRLRQVDIEAVPAGPGRKRNHWRRILFHHRGAPDEAVTGRAAARVADPAVGRPTRRLDEFRALLDADEEQHSALLSQLEDSRGNLENSQVQLEESYAELEAANAELRAMLLERDEIEEKLRQSEAGSRELLETAAQAILAVDLDQRISWVNEMTCQMFGYSREEIIGKKLGLLLPGRLRRVHSRHVGAFLEKPERRSMGRGRDVMGLRKDGRTFPIEVGLSSVRLDHVRLGVAFVTDISERKAAEAEIAAQNERLRQLTQNLTTVAEQENRKWARELHDVYSQRLVGVAMGLERLASGKGNESVQQALAEEVRTLAADIHRLSRRMHPNILHDLGLAAALRAEVAAFARECDVKISFQAAGVPFRLPDDVALCLYRVAQEALRNIRKHSGATRARVSLRGGNDRLVMLVEDFGDGFSIEPGLRTGGLGLVSMEERVLVVGGEFAIDSTPGKGTRVRVAVPVPSP